MTWFKVDDGFYDHPKVDQLPNAAVGLWVKCGAWGPDTVENLRVLCMPCNNRRYQEERRG